MPISAKVPTPLRDSKEINVALDVANTQVNANTAAIALNTTFRTSNSGVTKVGSYTVVAADDTANTKTIVTGLSAITSYIVQIFRSNVTVTGDAAISKSTGSLVIADGSTYVLTTGDVINWIAVGTV